MSTYNRIRKGLGRGPSESYRRRQRSRCAKAMAIGGTPKGHPTLGQVADREFLIATYDGMSARGGHAPGRDGLTYADLGRSEVAQIMDELAKAIRAGTYKPGPARKQPIPKPGGRGTRTLTIRNVTDRVVSAAVLQLLTPIYEPIFSASSYGFRPGRGTWTLLADLGATMAATGRYILAIDDVRKAFDRVVIPELMEDLREHVRNDGLLTLIEAVIRGGEDEDRTVGIAQGDPLSPLLLNVRLHNVHDLPLEGDPANPPWFRYADNLCYLTGSVPEGQQILDQVQGLLHSAGHELKGEDGPPVDLSHGEAQLLGFNLTCRDGRLRLGLGRGAWEKLRQDLRKAHEEENPPMVAKAVVRGWIESFGPAFESQLETDTSVRILGIAADQGFREIASQEDLRRWCRKSHGRWEAIREEAHRRLGSSMPEDTVTVAAPPATIAPGG